MEQNLLIDNTFHLQPYFSSMCQICLSFLFIPSFLFKKSVTDGWTEGRHLGVHIQINGQFLHIVSYFFFPPLKSVVFYSIAVCSEAFWDSDRVELVG